MSEEQGKEGQEYWYKERHGSLGAGWCAMAMRRGIATVVASGMFESDCDRVIADHNAARDDKARIAADEATIERLHRERLEETRAAGEAMQEYLTERGKLEARIRELEDGIRKQGKCFHCNGTGEPNCVTCHNYQGCICRPGEGRYAESCWNCKGAGVNAWAASLLSSSPVAQGGTET